MKGNINDFQACDSDAEKTIWDPYAHIKEEEEDNDGHGKGHHNDGKANYFTAALHIVNTIMGAGILSLPVVFRYLGVYLGFIFIGSIAVVNTFSVTLLLKCQEMTNKNGYAMFAKIAYGAAGSLLVKFIIIINNFGMCCAYLRIFGETAKNLAEVFIHDDKSIWVDNWHNYIYVIFIFIVMSLTIFKENLDSLRKASFLGVAGITTFFISLIVIFLYKLSIGSIEPYDSSILYPQGDALDWIGSLPTVFLAYTFQFNMFPVYFTLKKKTKEEMKKTTNLAIGFCFFVYSITGLIGYYMYRNNIKDTILGAMKSDTHSNDIFLRILLVIINIAFLMSSTMSIPLMFFSLKNNFINSLIFCKKKFTQNSEETNEKDQNEKLMNTLESDKIKEVMVSVDSSKSFQVISKTTNYIIIVALYLVIGTITILVPGLKVIFNMVGSTAANSISFILPNLFFLKLASMGDHPVSKIIPFCLLILGIIILLVCMIGEILRIVKQS